MKVAESPASKALITISFHSIGLREVEGVAKIAYPLGRYSRLEILDFKETSASSAKLVNSKIGNTQSLYITYVRNSYEHCV